MSNAYQCAVRNLRSREQANFAGEIVQFAGFLEFSLSLLGGGAGGVPIKAKSIRALLAKSHVDQEIKQVVANPDYTFATALWSSDEQDQIRAIAKFLSYKPALAVPALRELRALVSDAIFLKQCDIVQRIRNRSVHFDSHTVAKGITQDIYEQFMAAADFLVSKIEAFVDKFGEKGRLITTCLDSEFHSDWSSFSRQVSERLKSSNWNDAEDLRRLIDKLLVKKLTSPAQRQYLLDAATCIDSCIDFPSPPTRRFVHVPGKGTRVEIFDNDEWQAQTQEADGIVQLEVDKSDMSDPSALSNKEAKSSKAGRFAAVAGKVLFGAFIIAIASHFE